MQKHMILAVALVFTLAACGTPSGQVPLPTEAILTDGGQSGAAPTQESLETDGGQSTDGGPTMGEVGSAFTVTVTDIEETTFGGPGTYSCVNGQEVLGSGDAGGNQMQFALPAEISAGEYEILDGNIPVTLNFNGQVYNQDAIGVLTLDEVPTAQAELVSGSFDVFVNNAEGLTVNAEGRFDLLAGGVCP